jgi:hypothetical protein
MRYPLIRSRKPVYRAVAVLAGLVIIAAGLGCDSEPAEQAQQKAAKDDGTKTVETTRKEIGKNVFLEKQGERRRVIVKAEVCLREGPLEGLMCRKGRKEHEYILAADVDARHIHAALLGAGAKSGAPVQFEPKYVPASGDRIKITLQFEEKGKLKTMPAQQWIRNNKDKKNLDADWVFAGSQLMPNPMGKDKPPIYLANYGDVICVYNMEDAMLDLPVRNDNTAPENRNYEAHSERIPPLESKVTVILEPMPEKKR